MAAVMLVADSTKCKWLFSINLGHRIGHDGGVNCHDDGMDTARIPISREAQDARSATDLKQRRKID
jgi:hypothetical protein